MLVMLSLPSPLLSNSKDTPFQSKETCALLHMAFLPSLGGSGSGEPS